MGEWSFWSCKVLCGTLFVRIVSQNFSFRKTSGSPESKSSLKTEIFDALPNKGSAFYLFLHIELTLQSLHN
jgi:hypothetical protein